MGHMKIVICEKCKGSDFLELGAYKVCRYCRATYALDAEDILPKDSNISLDDDIGALLQKCRNDPANARRYAGLILDIDPGNSEAIKFLR
jgi:hypothetical protein